MTTTTAPNVHHDTHHHLVATWIAVAIVLVIVLAGTFALGRATTDDGSTEAPVKATQSTDGGASTPNTGPRACGVPGPPC